MEQNNTQNAKVNYEYKQSEVVTEVLSDIKKREKKGFLQYGTTVDRNDYDLKMWLQEAYEECLDMAIYLKSAINTIKKK
jgi:uncharacterized protein YbcC (UPF0753/DUF2309 family)